MLRCPIVSERSTPRRTPIALVDGPQSLSATTALTASIPPGSHVRLAADSLRSVMSGFDAERLAPEGGEPWPVLGSRLPRPQPETGEHRAPRQLLLSRCAAGAAAGQAIAVTGTFHSGGNGKGPSIAPWADVPITFRLEVAPPDAETEDESVWQPVSKWFGFILETGPAERLEAFLRADGTLVAGLFDRHLNPVAAPVEGLETDRPVALGTTETLGARGAPATSEASTRMEPGTRITVRDAAGRQAVSSPLPLRSREGEQLLFGEFHWHTEASGDGCRDVASSYRSARDGLKLDFAGAADHFPFDPPPSAWPNGLSLEACADIVDSFDAPGQFVTLLGIELSWRMGHYNFYWADRDELDLFSRAWKERRLGPLAGTVFAKDVAEFYGLSPEYFERAHPERTLIIPHHTNVTSENVYTTNGQPVWSHYYWPRGHYDPRFLRLAEMVQTRGCFESEETDPDWKIRHGAGGGSLRTGLTKGFRVGFTGGTDNHSGWPSRQQQGGWVGLTAVYADEFSRAGIMRGLYRRRCYATTGVRIGLDVRLNGAPMGSELPIGPKDERRLTVRAHGTAPLERVEVVSQGAVVARLPVDPSGSPDLIAEWMDDRRTRPVHDFYYYVRVRQQDGHCAWSSPIWGDLPLPEDPSDGGRSLGGAVAWS